MSRRSSRRRKYRHEAEADAGFRPGFNVLGLLPRLAGWVLLGLFLLLMVVSPLPLGANRVWAWAPMVVFLGLLAIPIALGLGDSAGFRVEHEERWPLLALLVCGLLFAFVGILQMSPHAPATGSAAFYERANELLGQAHDTVPSLSVTATRDTLLRCMGIALVFVIARALFRDPARARWLLYALLLSAVVVMIYALLQQTRTGSCYVGSYLKKIGDYTGDRCLMSGTFANSNSFGCFVGMAFAAALALLLQEKRRRRLPEDEEGMDAEDGARFLRWIDGNTMVLVALALLFIGAQLFSSSRAAFGATIAVSIGLVALAMHGRWRSRRQILQALGIAAVIAVAVLGIAGSAMMRKVSLSGEVATWERLTIWETSLKATWASPWLGWGLGAFPDIFLAYQPESTTKAYDKAHSTPVELFVETGILGTVPGLGMALIPLGVCVWGAMRRRRQRYLLVAAVAVPAVAMLHSTVDFSIQMPAIAFLSAAFLGMGWAQTFNRTPATYRMAPEAFTEDEE